MPKVATRQQASKAHMSIAGLVSQSRKSDNPGITVGGPTFTTLSSRMVDTAEIAMTNTLRSLQSPQTKSASVIAGGLATTSGHTVTSWKSPGRMVNPPSGVSDLTGSAQSTGAPKVPTVLGSSSVVAVSNTNSNLPSMGFQAATTTNTENSLVSTSSPLSVMGLPFVVAGSSSIEGDATSAFQPTAEVSSTTSSQRMANLPSEASTLTVSTQTTFANHVIPVVTTFGVISDDSTNSIVLPITSQHSTMITDAGNAGNALTSSSSQSKMTSLDPIVASSSGIESRSISVLQTTTMGFSTSSPENTTMSSSLQPKIEDSPVSPFSSTDIRQMPTDQPSAFAIGSQTFTVRASRILVANETIIPEGPAVSVNGTYVSLGKSEFVFGHKTETFSGPEGTSRTPTRGANTGTTFRTLGSATANSRPGSATASPPTHQSAASKPAAPETGFLGWFFAFLFWFLMLNSPCVTIGS